MDWEKTVAAAKRNEWITVRAGNVILAEGESFMDGDTVCIKCDPRSGKGTARYVRLTVAGQDYLVAERPRPRRKTAQKRGAGRIKE